LLSNGQKLKRAEEDRDILIEIRILSTLHHKNIVNFLGIILMKEKIGIVEEYYSTDLSKIMYSLKDSLKLLALKHIANGMFYLHSLVPSIIHRDLKPSNVLVQHEPPLFVIADFGLGRLFDQSLAARTGTVAYMAPEMELAQLERNTRKLTKYSYMVDVYSYGLLGAELYMGFHPLSEHGDSLVDSETHYSLEEKKERITIPSIYPKQLEELFKQCVEDDPKSRPLFKNILTILESLPASVENHSSIN